jgi:hypothetical protein
MCARVILLMSLLRVAHSRPKAWYSGTSSATGIHLNTIGSPLLHHSKTPTLHHSDTASLYHCITASLYQGVNQHKGKRINPPILGNKE